MFDKTFKDVANRRWPGLLESRKTCNINDVEMTIENPSNGAIIIFGGLQDSNLDRILGQEVDVAFLNEGTELEYRHFNQVNSRLRNKVSITLGKGDDAVIVPVKNKLIMDCNPTDRHSFLYPMFIQLANPSDGLPHVKPEQYASLKMWPRSNSEHLDEDYFDSMLAGDADYKRRYVDGDWKLDVDGALFASKTFKYMAAPKPGDDWEAFLAKLVRIVVAVDPAVSENNDETGIIVAGLDAEGHAYILADWSAQGSISTWADKIAEAFKTFHADNITVERNNGGVLVEETLRHSSANLPITTVWASRGKQVRAEPIAHLYERGLVTFVGAQADFKELQDQMVQYTPNFNRTRFGSPDRLDAMVWALFDLMIKEEERPAKLTSGPMGGFV